MAYRRPKQDSTHPLTDKQRDELVNPMSWLMATAADGSLTPFSEFESEEERREAYEANRAKIRDEVDEPGERPAAWWAFEQGVLFGVNWYDVPGVASLEEFRERWPAGEVWTPARAYLDVQGLLSDAERAELERQAAEVSSA